MSNSLGVIGLPHVRDALQALGFEVVSGDGFPDTSRRIRSAAASSALPVLVEDLKQIGLQQLISRLPEASPVVIVRGAEPILGDTRSSIPLTSSLGDYLGALGFEDLDPVLASIRVDADGTITDALPATPAPIEDNDGHSPGDEPDEPETEPSPHQSTGDWLADVADDSPQPEQAPAAPTSEHESAPGPTGSTLTDWLEDFDEPEPERVSAHRQVDEVDEEDFDGSRSPTSAAAERGHRADVDPAQTPDASPPNPPRRRRVSLPSFTGGKGPAPAADSAAEVDPLDEELFEDLPVGPEETGTEEDLDVEAAVDAVTGPSASTHRRRPSTAPAEVIACFSGKGGEGKSAVSLALAQAAAEVGGKSVCLIDANRAQGDLGLYLRVRTGDLPSLYDAVTIGDPASAILSPDQINDARQGRGDHIAFSIVQAPRPVKGSGDIAQEIAAVTAEHYAEAIQIARERFDLVIIDTQITEGLDTSGVIDRAIAPLLARGAYGIGICELTTPGVENLLVAMESLRQHSADGARMMSIANKVRPSITDYGKLPQLLGRVSKWKGAIHFDDRIYDDMVARRIPYAVPTMHRVVMDVLHSVTGDEEYNLRATDPDRSALPWWKWWLRR